MTFHCVIHLSMLMTAPLGSSPFTLQCCFIFFHTPCGSVASSPHFSFFFGHSHFLCAFSPHLKHYGLFSMTSCLLSSLTPYCITWLFNTSNLFSIIVSFFCSSPLLHFWARYPNFPHFLHILSSLPSSSALNLARAYFWLSISLISWLYWSKDIALCSGWGLSV